MTTQPGQSDCRRPLPPGWKYGFTQALCLPCWFEREGDRGPSAVREAPAEQCALCGRLTDEGIYIRIDPGTVPFPRWSYDP
jgi:hypothetical protein